MAFDYVVTVCGHANEHCPIFPGKTKMAHVGFEDPPKLTGHLPDGEEKLAVYRRVRDEIRRFVETLPGALTARNRNESMKKLEVDDPPMCCSTGLCGPQVDPVLVRFAADVKWLQGQGIQVQRFNLSQNPGAFVENDVVKQALNAKGESALPLVLVNGLVAGPGALCPERAELAGWLKLRAAETPAPAKSGCCCGGDC